MGRDRNDTHADKNGTEAEEEQELVPSSKSKSKSKSRESSDSESEDDRKHVKSDKGKHKSGKRKRHRSGSYEDSDSDSDSYSEYSSSSSEYSESESDSEEERRRSKRKEKKRRREREEERERKRRKREKEKKRREKEKRKENKRKKKKEKFERGKKGAVTNLWGKYGIIRETDMWNKRPEFTAWLAEVKQVNLESLPNWEEKQMFKQYYNLDAYHKHKMEKELKKGITKVRQKERTVFNDEEQRSIVKKVLEVVFDISLGDLSLLTHIVAAVTYYGSVTILFSFRLELREAREKKKEEEVEALKRSMQSGMAQAMKEQAQLKEEMAYQYKIGNFEAAAAIQRRLDPDVAIRKCRRSWRRRFFLFLALFMLTASIDWVWNTSGIVNRVYRGTSETIALSEKANKGSVVEDNMIEGIFYFICFCCSFTCVSSSFSSPREMNGLASLEELDEELATDGSDLVARSCCITLKYSSSVLALVSRDWAFAL
ncbi:nucleic acid-binding protein [Citrus sinensis]|uniref:Nucleic acid-binding protein n=1 Tax=Citrus sinensis TaxID=2711 RepID=A0ACB8NZ08_CITSI|nr:nucleic acid-binding protein [Citrus sinensis]